MNRLHVVIVEDQQSDAELIVVELRRAGFDPVWRRVTTEEEYLALLEGDSDGQAPDVVLADYNLPQFTGLRALELMRARGLDIPFILISGTVGEDVAVEVMKRGASDYLLKDRLARLGAAVQHALAQKALRASKQEAEQTIREAERRFRALYETGQALASLGTPEEILERVFAKIGDVLDNRNAYVALYDESNQGVLFPIYAVEGERQASTRRPFGKGRTEYVLRTRAPLCINRNVTAEMAARGIDLVGRKAASLLVVPMLAGDKVVGVIGLQDYIHEDVYTSDQVDLLATFASQAAIALENAWLFDETRRQSRRQEALNAVIVAASGVDGLDAALKIALDQMIDALHLDAGVVWIGSRTVATGIDEDVAFAVDRVTREAGIELSLGDLIVEDWNAPDHAAEAQPFISIAAQAGIRATLSIPIRSGNQRVGALAALTRGPRHWTPDDLALAKALARELGTAMERRWAQQQILQQLESLTTLYASAKKLSESLNLDDVVDYVVRTAVDSFGVRAAAIRRASRDGTLTLLATYPPGARHHRQIQRRWSDPQENLGPAGRALQTGIPFIHNDITAAADIPAERLASLQSDGIRSTAALPLISRDQPFGVLSLYSDEAEFFRPARIEHFQAYANLVAAALESARLFDDAGRRLDELQALRDIDAAISGSIDARVTLSIFLDKVTTHLRVDAADILLLNPRSQTLEFLTSRGFRTTALQHTRLRLGAGYAGLAALERRTVSVPDLREAKAGLDRSPHLADEGFISYFATPLIAKGQTQGVLEVFNRRPMSPDAEWLDFLSTLAGQAAIAIDSAALFENLQRANVELTLAYDTTLEGWSKALDLRDKETEGHTQRVADLALRLARAMGVPDETIVHVRRGALLHDIGKMGIPDGILLKPGPLTDDEWEVMRRHPVYAYQLLSPIAYLRPALAIPYAHHEKWDGSGYPRGLKGEEIPVEARIFAIVDVWDALTSDRPYRPAWPKEKAREHIYAQAGTHFDPKVAEMFLRIVGEMDQQG